MLVRLAILVMWAGCFSGGGGVNVNAALGDSAVQRVGGHYQFGTFSEIVEDRAVGTLFFARDLAPIADANAVGAWGARIQTIGRGRWPGLYLMGAYGQNDLLTDQEASSVLAGAGIAYGRMRQGHGVPGRAYAGVSLGVVFHREHQEMIDQTMTGHFLGLELTVLTGFDLLGPIFSATKPTRE